MVNANNAVYKIIRTLKTNKINSDVKRMYQIVRLIKMVKMILGYRLLSDDENSHVYSKYLILIYMM